MLIYNQSVYKKQKSCAQVAHHISRLKSIASCVPDQSLNLPNRFHMERMGNRLALQRDLLGPRHYGHAADMQAWPRMRGTRDHKPRLRTRRTLR